MSKIGTHDGKFHADEVLACALLKNLPEFKDHIITRTRDTSVLDQCEIVVDVGGVYNHSLMRYDHHQRGFEETMHSIGVLEFHTKLSSAGLIYAHYGKKIIASILDLPFGTSCIDQIFAKAYETFIEAIDAVDNGIAQFDGLPRYYMGGTLSARVNRLNPPWNDDVSSPKKRFLAAMKLANEEFCDLIGYLYKSWRPAREIVMESIHKRFEVDRSGQIFELQNGGVPWKDHFFSIEKELHLEDNEIAYVLFCDSSSMHWRLMAVPNSANLQFESRVPFPPTWCGLRGGELSKVVGFPNCVFVHASGFTAGHQDRDQAIQMARKALIMTGNYKPNYKKEAGVV